MRPAFLEILLLKREKRTIIVEKRGLQRIHPFIWSVGSRVIWNLSIILSHWSDFISKIHILSIILVELTCLLLLILKLLELTVHTVCLKAIRWHLIHRKERRSSRDSLLL